MRLVFATLGSLGDLHPVLAFATALRARGHHVEIATSEMYRAKIAALGFVFHSLRPDLLASGEHVISAIMDGPRGTERLMRDHLFPAVREMHADLQPVVAGADALIASELVFPAPMLAAAGQVRWISFTLAPASLFSRHDPSVLPAARPIRWLQRHAPGMPRLVKRVAKIISHAWWRPLRTLRRELGLPPGRHPLFEGKYSPLLNLVLFSSVLQPPQPDWPASAVQTGFLFHDETTAFAALPRAVAEFLTAGTPPLVFTLGSAAVHLSGDFYQASAAAAGKLGRRALLLLGQNTPPSDLPRSVLGWDYLPYAQIFPHAAAVIHQGGIGTTAQTLRAGKPMLIVPFAHDQFDNAARIARLGAGRTLGRSHYDAPRVARELGALLDHPHYASAAAALGARMRAERGVEIACEALERALAGARR